MRFEMTDENIGEAVEIANALSMRMPSAREVVRLRGLVADMAAALREPPQSEATLDDAARYLRALWPRGERMTFATYDTGEAWLRWSSSQGPDEAVSVRFVDGEAPSATLARLVARLREMAVAERDAAEARAKVLRAAIGGES